MERVAIRTESRTATGKGPNRRLRAQGKIPAVVYGPGVKPEKVALDAREFGVTLKKVGTSAMFTLVGGDGQSSEDRLAVIREIQRDPVSRQILHVDLYQVRLDVEADFEVPVTHSGTPVGVREGGILEMHRHSVQVRCVPLLLPKSLEADVSELKVNHVFHAGDLKLPEGVKLITDPEEVLFSVLPPKDYVEEAPAAEAEEVAQPEVITRKKGEEEEAESGE
jgi:large subunit ribosomal protein L25